MGATFLQTRRCVCTKTDSEIQQNKQTNLRVTGHQCETIVQRKHSLKVSTFLRFQCFLCALSEFKFVLIEKLETAQTAFSPKLLNRVAPE